MNGGTITTRHADIELVIHAAHVWHGADHLLNFGLDGFCGHFTTEQHFTIKAVDTDAAIGL